MRTFIISIITLLFATACTDQERIDQYEKQLKESNEALEKIIDFRISSFNAAAAENPEKAGPWAKKAHAYFEECQNILEKWPLSRSEADSFMVSLEKLQGSDFNKSKFFTPTLYIENSSFEVFKNQLQIHLNQYLTELLFNTGVSDKWYFYSVHPEKIKIGDSTLVIIEGMITDKIPDYAIVFDQKYPIKLNTSLLLGHFFLPKNLEDSIIRGQVEVLDNYAKTVDYYPFNIDSNYNDLFAPVQYYQPLKSPQKNP